MDDLAITPLYDLHLELGAKMVPFAGYSMPVQYPAGVMKEHLHCRASAGLFDVSHMGQVWIDGPSWEAVAAGFEQLVPQDVLGLADGRQRYGFFTNDSGGMDDDLMFARRGDRLFVVVNAACKEADIAKMRAGLEPDLSISVVEDRALIALQGPAAETALSRLDPDAAGMRFMDVGDLQVSGETVWVSRSGYTGEDGYEISVPASAADALCRDLLKMEEVEPIGLGARDSLRLEGGLCLYGNDLDTSTTPVEANLVWAIQKARRVGGSREGGFPGARVILPQMSEKTGKLRVGLRPDGRAPVRGGAALFATADSPERIGIVTSGGFGPSVGGPVSMGYVPREQAASGTQVFADVRGKRLPVTVSDLPFVAANFKR